MSVSNAVAWMSLAAFAAVAALGLAGGARAIDRPADRALLVVVTNAAGEPIVDASVEALSKERSIAAAISDARGEARLLLPQGPVAQWVVALKAGAGLDYRVLSQPGRPVEELPDEVSLTLDGARTVQIEAVDAEGRPRVGIRMTPWIIGVPERRGSLNLSASVMASVRTDIEGVASFDWVPRDALREIGGTFLVQTPGLHWADPPEDLLSGTEDVRIVAHLERASVIRGTVRLPDDRPASGVTVLAEGRGDGLRVGRAIGTTKADGTYTLMVPPRQTYTVTMEDDGWAGTRFGVTVGDDETVVGADLAAERGVLIHGRMTRADGQPVAGELVLLGLRRKDGIGRPMASDGYWRPFADVTLQRSAWTDADGRYAFRVVAGEYALCGMGATPGSIHEPLRIRVGKEQKDVRVDLTRSTAIPVLGTTGAPFVASSSDLYEYAFLPAWRGGRSDGSRACMQCHRPHGGLGTPD